MGFDDFEWGFSGLAFWGGELVLVKISLVRDRRNQNSSCLLSPEVLSSYICRRLLAFLILDDSS